MDRCDVIVIGAGSAGAALARRLGDAGAQVLLLEAGGASDAEHVRVPALIDTALDGPLDWGTRTVAQPELLGRRIFLSHGRCLGGTSAINAMVYMRGNRGDYDGWAALGNRGWGYADVLPSFRRAEGNRHLDDAFHGTEGPLTVSSFPGTSAIHRAFLAAAREVGLPENPDVNGERQEGCGPFQATIGLRGRCSAAVAYLSAPPRSLRIETHCHVTRLRIDGHRVTGVDYLCKGEARAAEASEVILCAGAINSPQVLMLSGIGPADHLAAQGIGVAADLPGVGANLHDHLQLAVRFQIDAPQTLFGLTGPDADAALRRSLDFGDGPFHSNLCETGGFLRTDPADPWPDVQLHCESHYAPHYFDGTPADRHGFGLLMNVCRPKSRGTLRLASADPLDRPLIDPAYLSHPDDLAASLRGLRACLRIGAADAWRPLGARRTDPAPGADDDDDALTAFLRARATTIWHPVGTCRMGQDGMAVVDDRLRVHGLDGLRVADASIMPTIVSGNTNAACIMIGEKAADLVLNRTAA